MKSHQQLTHPYSEVNISRQDFKQILYDNIELPWGQMDRYTVSHKIGRGRYSQVFEGKDTQNKEKVVIKVLLPIAPEKIRRQYHILNTLSHPNIIKLHDVVRCSNLRTASFVFENFEHQDFRQIYNTFSLQDIKHYMRELFETLDYIHGQGIMHRDIKPFNVLINHRTRQLKLIDFGLAEYYFPTRENNTKVASTYYKAPQIYFGNPQYDYRVDCWAAGMIMAGMIFKKTPFLVGNDHIEQILKLGKLVGTREMIDYIQQYRLSERRHNSICADIILAFKNGDIKEQKTSTLQEFITPYNKENATAQALDLILQLLAMDYKKRMTARQALQHPFLEK